MSEGRNPSRATRSARPLSIYIAMRILVLGVNYWPENTGIAPVKTARCEYLASRGHEVTVCTTFPYYPEWRVAEKYCGRVWQREKHNDVTILRSWAWIPAKVTSRKRMLFEASFLAFNLLRAYSAGRPDLLIIESPPLGLGFTAALLGSWWHVPFVYDVMDLQPDAAVDLGMLRPGSLMRWLYRLERLAYDRAALVSTLTGGMRDRIVAKGIAPEKVAVFGSGAAPDLFSVCRGTGGEAFRHAHGLDNKFLVVHSGNMGIKQGLEVVLGAAELSRDAANVHYLLVGDGAARPVLQARAAELRLTNVSFLPVLARGTFLQMLAAADLSLITQQRTVSDIVFPSKTVTMLAAGSPVLASVSSQSEVARAVIESGGGMVLAPEDPRELSAAVLALQNEPGKLSAMSVAGRRYAREHWNDSKLLSLIESTLRGVAVRAPVTADSDSVLVDS